MKNSIWAFCLIILASCTENKINPVVPATTTDPDLAKFAAFLTSGGVANWVCLNIKVDTVNYETRLVNCDTERQFDILTSMQITAQYDSKLLKVVNTYKCSPTRITYFELKHETNFSLLEKDDKGKIIKGYDFIDQAGNLMWLPTFLTDDPTVPAGMFLYARTIDTSYFDLTKKGSLRTPPKFYSIYISKQ